jgi:hypothetical protein
VTVGSASQAVDVENAKIEGSPQVGSTVEIKGVNNNGVIIASEISVQEKENKSEKSSEHEES